jgi:hypothetical protein
VASCGAAPLCRLSTQGVIELQPAGRSLTPRACRQGEQRRRLAEEGALAQLTLNRRIRFAGGEGGRGESGAEEQSGHAGQYQFSISSQLLVCKNKYPYVMT